MDWERPSATHARPSYGTNFPDQPRVRTAPRKSFQQHDCSNRLHDQATTRHNQAQSSNPTDIHHRTARRTMVDNASCAYIPSDQSALPHIKHIRQSRKSRRQRALLERKIMHQACVSDKRGLKARVSQLVKWRITCVDGLTAPGVTTLVSFVRRNCNIQSRAPKKSLVLILFMS
jgi:hypothetical protein